MLRQGMLLGTVLAVLLLAAQSPGQNAGERNSAGTAPSDGIKLKPADQMTEGGIVVAGGSCATCGDDENWDIFGPVRLRSADPEETGEIEVKNKFDYGTSSDGSDDDVEYETEIEWGIAPNHELIFEVPVELGDGKVHGNADITVGWHWRLWKEQEVLPAFALRNFLRLPSGYNSEGVDWTLIGLLTKSICPDKWRVHLNPFIKSVNGENATAGEDGGNWYSWEADDEDPRHFLWGVIVGTDYKLNECLRLNVDYIHESGEMYGDRNQHTAEVGLDSIISEHQQLGLATRVGLDGDGAGDNWGLSASYIWVFDAPALGKCH